jgi:hypothetical protein
VAPGTHSLQPTPSTQTSGHSSTSLKPPAPSQTFELPSSQTTVPSGQGGSPVELLLASVVELVLGSPEVLVAVVPLVVWSVVVPGPVVAVTGPVLASPELELEPGSLVGEPLVVGVPVDPGPVVPASVPLPVLAAALVLAEPSVVALSSPQALTSRAGSSRARGGARGQHEADYVAGSRAITSSAVADPVNGLR